MLVVFEDIAWLVYPSFVDTAGISEFPSGMTTFIYHRVYLSQCGRYLDGLTTHATAEPSCQVRQYYPLSGCGCGATNGPKSCLLFSCERKNRVSDQKPGAAHSARPIKSLSCYRLTVYTPLTEQHSKKSRCSHSPLRSLGDLADFCTGPCAEIYTAVTVTDSPASRRSEVSGILYR